MLGRYEESMRIRKDVYSGHLRLHGKEHFRTLRAADNYADVLIEMQRYAEAKSLMRKTTPVARRVLGDNHLYTFEMRLCYAKAHYLDTDTTLDELREAVTSLEDAARTAQRVLGGAHPTAAEIEKCLRDARAILGHRESGRKVNLIIEARQTA